MSRTPIKIVCFDVGGVIIRHCRSWREGCAAAGLEVKDGSDSERAARKRHDLACALTCGKLSAPDFFERMSGASGGAYSAGEIERTHHAWLLGEYEGVGDVLRRLVAAGRAETGVLSNTNEPHWVRFEARGGQAPEFPSASVLRHIHTSHRLGLMKPDLAIYEAFERGTGFRGGEILFFEDVEENVAAARARGWRAELVDHTRGTAGQIAGVLEREGLV